MYFECMCANCLFSSGVASRQQDLYRVLKAYTVYRPEEGYCQAQAPVAAVLLMHMPAEVRGCWGTQREGGGLWRRLGMGTML